MWHQDSQCCPGAWYNSSHIHRSTLFTEFHTKIHPDSFRPQESCHFIQYCWCYWIRKDVLLKILGKTSLKLQMLCQKVFLWVDKQLEQGEQFWQTGLTLWCCSWITNLVKGKISPSTPVCSLWVSNYSLICLFQTRNVSMDWKITKAMCIGQSLQFSHPLVRNSLLNPRKLLKCWYHCVLRKASFFYKDLSVKTVQ